MDYIDVNSLLNTVISWYPSVVKIIVNIVGVLIGISFPLIIFFVIGIIYCVENLKKIRIKEGLLYDTKVELAFENLPDVGRGNAKRWENITKHLTSPNQNDWKQAIIESDVILDDILSKMGYRGESVGEKLKRVAKGDFLTLDDAWEAHKVRNLIAHQGSGYNLSEHEAKKTINLYKRVFEEFYYI